MGIPLAIARKHPANTSDFTGGMNIGRLMESPRSVSREQ